MPLFAFRCLDKPGALDLRVATRDAHLAYLGGFKDELKLAGPMLGEDDKPVGSILFVELADRAAAEAFAANDPYAKAGLFASVDVTGFRPSSESWGDAGRPRQSGQAPAGVRLCALADLADPGSKGFRFREGGKMFAGFVVRVGGQIRGYVDSCPHAGWPLAAWDDRYLTRDGDLILCGGHAALFRPLDGVCVAGPCADDRLTRWPVAIVGDQILTA